MREHFDLDDEVAPLPFLLWVILLFQARAWLLLVMAGASRQQGDTLLRLFVPDTSTFFVGLAMGLPALLCMVLSGYRQRFPRVWRVCRYVLLVSGALLCIGQLSQWNTVALEASPTLFIMTLFDGLNEFALFTLPHLKKCFVQ
ncbi:DUF2919 domain-containing protein [Tatumella sp. TA1]|uniref:DUF2919 family protein n=1 Tax=Rosenbergiella collisarenosi TaxID=1544695 RepID=UPI0008F9304D|nr:DUF2919 family protein [Rosenbergiella collisarenosi]MBT0720356.1 DUF2919 domain-containing protein [Rosenbergiella collisarenosi]QGX91939.1 DUF2919 domain-containing protein [Tatumella sp. TA1]